MADMPVVRFSEERRRDLHKLCVPDEQISEIESILPMCQLLIESAAPLSDTRDKFDKLIEALRFVERIVSPSTKATREALNRWQMAAYARRHRFGSDPEFTRMLDLGTLIDAAREAKRVLGSDQRRSRAATPEPIRLIDDALVLGWAKHQRDTANPAPYCMPPRKFREIVQYAYEAMGLKRDYIPERALRAHRARRKGDAVRRRQERERLA